MHQLFFFTTPEPEKAKKSVSKAVLTAVTRVKIPDLPKTKPAPYGNCSCGQPIQFPGLDAYYCESCGYRIDTNWLMPSSKKGGKA